MLTLILSFLLGLPVAASSTLLSGCTRAQSPLRAENGSHTVSPGATPCWGPSGHVADSLFSRDCWSHENSGSILSKFPHR